LCPQLIAQLIAQLPLALARKAWAAQLPLLLALARGPLEKRQAGSLS
jgi:hypothetical protein